MDSSFSMVSGGIVTLPRRCHNPQVYIYHPLSTICIYSHPPLSTIRIYYLPSLSPICTTQVREDTQPLLVASSFRTLPRAPPSQPEHTATLPLKSSLKKPQPSGGGEIEPSMHGVLATTKPATASMEELRV